MTTRSLVPVSLLLLLVASVARAQDATLLFAELRGSNERPTPNNSTAVGAALITIDTNNNVTYEVNYDGLQNPTLSHIHFGTSNDTGPVRVNLALVSSDFNNGRVKGRIQVDPALAADIKANPSTYYVNVHTTTFPDGEIRGQLLQATEYDIAVAGNVTTGAGDRFVTDARVFNPSSTAKAVSLVEYLISGAAGNTVATASKVLEIAPRGEAVLDDVTGLGALNVPGSTGALRITSSLALAVTSNIYNDQRPARGTFGQFVPGPARSGALRRGVIPHLSNKNRDVANPSGFRTNVGFFNPNQGLAALTLVLRDPAGTLVGSSTLSLPGLSQQQNAITAYFPGVDLSNAAALTLSVDSTQPIFAYGAVNDNVSGDSIYVPAQPDPGATP